jgi:lycopene cyclase domain-containing protein
VNYALLDVIFLTVIAVLVLAGFAVKQTPGWPAVALAAAVLLVATVVFDNIMISIGLVAYNPDRIAGVFLGVAPIEDFAYTIAAVVGLPALWALLSPRTRPRASDD